MELTAGRRATLTATLAFAQLLPHAPELRLLHRYLGSWRGIGDIVGGMRRLGYELQLTGYGNGYSEGHILGHRHHAAGAWRLGVRDNGVGCGAAGGVGRAREGSMKRRRSGLNQLCLAAG